MQSKLLSQTIDVIKGDRDFQPPKARPHHPAKNSTSTTRRTVYKGRKIAVRTTYRIEIDGEPLKVHIQARDDGTVICHGLPNYAFGSAVDIARRMIDLAPLAGPLDESGTSEDGGQKNDRHP